MCFDGVTDFKVLHLRTFVKGGAHTHCIDAVIVAAAVYASLRMIPVWKMFGVSDEHLVLTNLAFW